MSGAAQLGLAAAALVAAFLAGMYAGSRDRLCATTTVNGSLVVWCAQGSPADSLETARHARQGGA